MADDAALIATLTVFQHSRGMPMKFHGELQALKDRLLPLDLEADWQEMPYGVWRLTCRDHAGMNWSSTRGTVWFDGPPGPRRRTWRRPGGRCQRG
jgi:hypothetical protein